MRWPAPAAPRFISPKRYPPKYLAVVVMSVTTCARTASGKRDDVCLGAINVWRREVSPFSDNHIDLLKTFADQTVIAFENVRLFTELESRNRELTTALDQQTATAEILRVISRSPTDLQPGPRRDHHHQLVRPYGLIAGATR